MYLLEIRFIARPRNGSVYLLEIGTSQIVKGEHVPDGDSVHRASEEKERVPAGDRHIANPWKGSMYLMEIR